MLPNDCVTGRIVANFFRVWPGRILYAELRPAECASTTGRSELGRRSRKALVLLAFGLMAACASRSQEKPIEAWWLNAAFTPSETAYESLPVNEINPSWVKISVLSYASLPPDAKSDLAWMHKDGFVFQVDNYFKRRGVVDRGLSGVFEDKAGQKGRFLLVLE